MPSASCPVFHVKWSMCFMSSVLCCFPVPCPMFHAECSMFSVSVFHAQCATVVVSSLPCIQCSMLSVPVFHIQCSLDQCSNVPAFQCSAFHVFSVPCPMFHAYPTVTYEKLYLGKGGSLFYSEGILFFRNDVFQRICFSTPKQD